MFIVVEGIEGSGKSTLAAGLADRLRGAGRDVLVAREPGGTEAGDAIRRILLQPGRDLVPVTEAFLVNASRAQLVEEVIRPALSAGRIVICDRYVDSTLAYQGYGRGIPLEILSGLCTLATGGLTADLTILLDLPLEVSRERLQSRGEARDRMESADAAFHERVRAGFLELAANRPSVYLLDAAVGAQRLLDRAWALLTTAGAR
ncbi:MAG: dTMP kinase [Vulcanimicrobiaceae bacterium]